MSSESAEVQELDEDVINSLLEDTTEPSGEEAVESEVPNSDDVQDEDLIDVNSLAESHLQEEERKRNRAFAKNRVTQKKLKEEVQRLQSQTVEADVSDLKKPRRTDFLTPQALEQYDFDKDLAMAAFEDALDDYNDQVGMRRNQANQGMQERTETLNQQILIEEDFDQHAEKISKRIPDLDLKIDNAAKVIPSEGILAIKQLYGETAPLVLATLGSDLSYTSRLWEQDQITVLRALEKLNDKCLKTLSSAEKQVSMAPSETPVKSNSAPATANIEAAMKKAADAGNHKKYRELKEQLTRVKRANRGA